MPRRRLLLFALLTLSLVFGLAQGAAGADRPAESTYSFLAEAATIEPVPGHPPQLFKPENRLSRIEVAYFLYLLDGCLARDSQTYGQSLTLTLARLWSSAHPEAGEAEAQSWARTAVLDYRRLLLEYNREMGPMGFELGPDAYPDWARWQDDDFSGR